MTGRTILSILAKQTVSRAQMGMSTTRFSLVTGDDRAARFSIGAAPAGLSVALSSNYTLVSNDDGNRYFCTGAPTLTVNSSLPTNFGVAVFGAANFTAGSGVTITDNRLTINGATTYQCVLVPAPTANAYILEGNK